MRLGFWRRFGSAPWRTAALGPALLALLGSGCAATHWSAHRIDHGQKILHEEFPKLLNKVDLRAGTFDVIPGAWISLADPDREKFVGRCSQVRKNAVGKICVAVRARKNLVAYYDGSGPVFIRWRGMALDAGQGTPADSTHAHAVLAASPPPPQQQEQQPPSGQKGKRRRRKQP